MPTSEATKESQTYLDLLGLRKKRDSQVMYGHLLATPISEGAYVQMGLWKKCQEPMFVTIYLSFSPFYRLLAHVQSGHAVADYRVPHEHEGNIFG